MVSIQVSSARRAENISIAFKSHVSKQYTVPKSGEAILRVVFRGRAFEVDDCICVLKVWVVIAIRFFMFSMQPN